MKKFDKLTLRTFWRSVLTILFCSTIVSSFSTRLFVYSPTALFVVNIISGFTTISLLYFYFYNLKSIDSDLFKKWNELNNIKRLCVSLSCCILLLFSVWMALRIFAYLYTTSFGERETIEASAKKHWGTTAYHRMIKRGMLKIEGIDSLFFFYPLTDEEYEKLTDKEFKIYLDLRKSELGFIVEAWRCYKCGNLE